MKMKNHDSRCRALTKSGKPCRAAATDGGLCFFHANPKKAVELGRIGGKKNSRVHVGSDPLPDLDNVTAVRDALKRLIADVYAGKLHPRTAGSLAPLLHLQLRAIEKTDFEKRLAKTEQRLIFLKAELDKSREKERKTAEAERGAIWEAPDATHQAMWLSGWHNFRTIIASDGLSHRSIIHGGGER